METVSPGARWGHRAQAASMPDRLRIPRTEGRSARHIVHVFHGFGIGGSEVRTCQILNALGGNFRHTIVTLNGDVSAATLLQKSVDVSFLNPEGFIRGSFLRNVVRSRNLLRKLKPDLLIGYSWGSIEWLVANSLFPICPGVFAVEGFGTDEATQELPHRRVIRRLTYPRCTAVLACSKLLAGLATRSWHVRPERIAYIPNGIDLAKFRPRAHDAPSGPVRLGVVASLTPVKNHLFLIDAFRMLPEGAAELLIAGDGPERVNIQQRIQDCGLSERITLLGHHPEPAAVLATLDVFCLSSKSEQMPMAVLEAMASGLPVVATDVGDIKQMVCDENRPFVVPADDPVRYAAALAKLVQEPLLRAAIGSANRVKCKREFGFDLMLDRHKALYESCMSVWRRHRTRSGILRQLFR